MLKQCYFFLKFWWEILKIILRHYILFFICSNRFSLVIKELTTGWLRDNFSGIIKEDSCRHIRQKISQPILRRIIYPLCNPYLSSLIVYHYLRSCITLTWSLRSLNLCIVIPFSWLLTNLLSCWWSNRSWNLLNFFWWGRPNWYWWHNLHLLLLDLLLLLRGLWLLLLDCWLHLLLLYKPLICNLWHFICFYWIIWLRICSLSTVDTSSVSKNGSWSGCPWSLATVKSYICTSYRISRSRSF